MEDMKFSNKSKRYHEAMEEMLQMGFSPKDYIHHNPLFNGYVNIARYLSLYEAYKMVWNISGHIAEVGTWKGASLIFFAKLVEIFEPHSYTLVHGFDWFRGMEPGADEVHITKGSYRGDYEKLCRLVEIQGLDHVVRIHNMDVTEEIDGFFEKNPSIQLKLAYFDAGLYDVVRTCLPLFWERLNSGGILLFDQFNHRQAPGETRAVREFLPGAKVWSFPFSRQPSGYIIKDG